MDKAGTKAIRTLEDVVHSGPFRVLKLKPGGDLLKYNQEIFRNFMIERLGGAANQVY